MKYSILVPVYNVEKYLSQCIESVLMQSVKEYELILVNDGSTDTSPQICQEYVEKDARVKYFSKENEGLLLTRRYSINKAQGEYILFLDSDDYWQPNTLSVIDQAIEESNADLITFRFRRVRDDGTLVYEDKDVFPDKTLFTKQDKEKFISKFVSSSRLNVMWGKCVRREIVDVSADYSCFKDKKGEDLLQSIALIKNADSIYYINDVLYNYRLSTSGRGRNFKLKYITDYEEVRSYVLENLKAMNLSDETLIDFYTRYIEGLMLFMNSIVKMSKDQKAFAEYCNMIKGFNTYKETHRSIDHKKLNGIASFNYRLFSHDNYFMLYVLCSIHNIIRDKKKIMKGKQ